MRVHFTMLPLLLALVVLLGCGLLRSGAGGPPAPPPLRVERRAFDRQDGVCAADGTTSCARLHVEYPDVVGARSSDTAVGINTAIARCVLRPYLKEGTVASTEDLAEQFVRAFRASQERFPDYVASWSLTRVVTVLIATDDLLVLRCGEREALGSAQPTENVTYVSLRASSGAQLHVADLIAPEARDQLDRLAEERFRAQKRIPPGTPLEAAGWTFEGGSFTLPENFAVTPDGLLFRWDVYEIGPFTAGPTELLLPLADVRPLLRTDAPPWPAS